MKLMMREVAKRIQKIEGKKNKNKAKQLSIEDLTLSFLLLMAERVYMRTFVLVSG